MVYIVGIGPGNKDYILPKAEKIMKNCDVIIGFERAINSLKHIENNKVIINSLKDILKYLTENSNKKIAIAASGDPCFYGITDYINKNYEGKIEVVTGISSFQYLCFKT